MKWVVLIIAALIALGPAVASAQAGPEASPRPILELNDVLDTPDHPVAFWATRVYMLEGASFTEPHWFRFSALAFATPRDAVNALDDVPAFFEAIDAAISFRSVSAGDIDGPYVAATAEVDGGYRGYLAITTDRFLIVGETAGNVIIPTDEVLAYVLTIGYRLDASQPQNGRTLFRDYLPSLDEMPAGYSELGGIDR